MSTKDHRPPVAQWLLGAGGELVSDCGPNNHPFSFGALSTQNRRAPTSETKCLHTHPRGGGHLRRGGLQHNIFKPAQRRHEIGADIAIVARKHRGDASTRRQSYSPTAALYGH